MAYFCTYYINAYVNGYTVACNKWNSVACNTTRRCLFYFMCVKELPIDAALGVLATINIARTHSVSTGDNGDLDFAYR